MKVYIEMKIHNTTPSIEMVEKAFAKFVHGQSLTVAHWYIEAGGKIPPHRHVHEQIINCLEGEFHIYLENELHILSAGNALVIPSDALHSAEAITDIKCIDVFYPVREDYRL